MKILCTILCLLLIIVSWNAFSNEHRGVYFKSKEVGVENRTGIDLSRKGAIPYKNKFSIEFDIAFRDLTIRYGYIFQLKEIAEQHQLDVISRDEEVFIVLDKKETKLNLPHAKEHEGLVNQWLSFKLTVNAVTGEVEMYFDGQSVVDKIEFPVESELQWTFGVVNRYGFNIDEVSPMSVRNIRFSDQDELKHYWPFDYSKRSRVKDTIGGKVAEIINPAWVLEQHQEWKKIRSLVFSELPQIVFKQESEEIYFVQRKAGLTKYSLSSKLLTHENYKTGNPFYEDAQQAYFDKNKQLKVYSDYKKLVSAFDEKNGSWSNSFDSLAFLPKYWHHNNLLHPIDSSLVSVGGYGYFTYFNSIRKLNKNNEWEEMELKGDRFEPRYLAALGQSEADKNVFYLFGGLGNETGKQILGKKFFFDLYKIDFEAGYISKVWALEDEPVKESYTPVNSMIVNEKEGCFYTLCFAHGRSQTDLQLIKAQLNEPTCKFIGSKIPYTFNDISSYADLYHWKQHNKLVAILMKQMDDTRFEVELYALNYPPSEIEPVLKSKVAPAKFSLLFWLAAIVVFFGAGITLLLLRRKRKGKVKLPKASELTMEIPSADEEQYKGKVLTFGGFHVFNRNGEDITYRFSPTLKELFLLILLHTIDDNKGISSRKIQEYLWPDKNDSQAKNNRGVNIKKLRVILQDVGNINISFDGSYWRITHEQNVFCDIEFIKQRFQKKFDVGQPKEFERVISVLSRGGFLTNIEAEWLDNVKDDFSGRIVTRLEEVCHVLEQHKNKKALLEISDVLFTFDQMNETALRLKCNILNRQGKHSLALEVYNHYTKVYRSIYNEDFGRTFKDLTS